MHLSCNKTTSCIVKYKERQNILDKRELDECMSRVLKGDETAFGRLYEETRRGLYAFIYGYLKNRQDAEDAMQNVYIRIRRYAYRYTPGTDARAWIFSIAKNIALNALKKKKRVVPLESISEMPAKGGELHGELFDLMERVLDEEEFRIIVLHVLWGYKHREIAEQLSMPTGTVTSKYKRAIEKIQKEWEAE